MSVVAPKGRKHLCADALFRLLHAHFATIADDGVDEVEIPLDDTLMSAFAMFSLKAPSLLAFDKQRAEGNLKTIYGIERAPCDTRMRERLDPVAPESLRPSFTLVFRQLQRGKALEPMVFLDGHYLVALDGTGYFSSPTIHCDSCLHKAHRNGSVTYYHQMLGAAIIHPDFRAVIPLMPEPIVKQDGTEKNDCERNAAKRFIAKLRHDHPHLKFIITEDALSSNAPHIETLHDYGCHYILGVKEGDHTYLFQQVQAAEEAGRVTCYKRHDHAAGLVHRFRFVNDLPLNGSRKDVRVNVIEYWEVGPDKVQHFSWVTDLRVHQRNVYKLMRGGRARWKIENETFNTLKNQGYNFEHNYGHGEKNLSVVFAMLMMLAFLVDQTQQLCCDLFRAVWAKLGSKRQLWESMRSLFYTYALQSMRQLLEALFYGLKRPIPIFAIDTS
jgi:Transposase DDE domain